MSAQEIAKFQQQLLDVRKVLKELEDQRKMVQEKIEEHPDQAKWVDLMVVVKDAVESTTMVENILEKLVEGLEKAHDDLQKMEQPAEKADPQ
ncbi:hypothetical protein L5515_006269 [Caenorhabditis briggsae]|uniref:Uncharacterized protein n=1 Tax=Caenorhabditis briggsae TaxID=6238 RepID=A0AAE9F429_CAEBR|nr:hypothetical protein L3Y34_006460 [Caenorhabditis briggsae]UMM32504.1 hypothetical protein L5515_006269 [Caenorhabditis briggsae]